MVADENHLNLRAVRRALTLEPLDRSTGGLLL